MVQDGNNKVPSHDYYNEYHGHKVRHLKIVLAELRKTSERLIFTAGDSSLDNKYYVKEYTAAPPNYRHFLSPPTVKEDVTYWLNHFLQQSETTRSTAAINTAVEESTLNERTFRLRPQDEFIRDNIQADDVLLVSVGGNDIALLPCPCTIASIGCLLCLPESCISRGFACCACPCDDYCCGCTTSLASCACACPPCMGYFKHMFGTRIEHYIKAITSKTRPRKILVSMIYYPDEANVPGWAGKALAALGYNKNPSKLQALIRKAYQDAISEIRIPGAHVIPVPLFRVLDGKNTRDYVARVEPSSQGGKKIAELVLDLMNAVKPTKNVRSLAAPTTSLMDR